MKKLQGFMSFVGLLCMTATVSAGWGSGGGYGSGGGSMGGYGSAGGYGTSYGSTGYSSGNGSSGGYTSGYGSSGYGSSGYGSSGYGSSGNGSSGNGSSGAAHVGPLRRLAASIHSHRANRLASAASNGSSGGGSSGMVYSRASYGSSGGYSSVSHGSSGGGYGSSGSYSRVHHGSSGGGVSYGGSTGGYSHVGYGSSGSNNYSSGYSSSMSSYGTMDSSSSGGIYDSSPAYSSPSTYSSPMSEGNVVPSASNIHGASANRNANMLLISSSKSEVAVDEIHLNVDLPESANVFVNGNLTTSQGGHRHFVSKNLEAGSNYRFELRAERDVEGRKVVESKTLVLASGSSETIHFALEEKPKAVETVLTLNVPNDAKVVLAGNNTKSVGDARTYRTHELSSGQVWDDYTIIVTWNGQVKEKTIRLVGGDELEVSFSFDNLNTVAQR